MNRDHNEQKHSGVTGFLATLIRWRKFIILNVGGVTLLSAVVSLLLPQWYKSSVTILPPKNPNPLSGLGLSTGALARQFVPFRSFGSFGTSQDIYNYLAILRSRTLMESIVRKFDLMTVYGIRSGFITEAIDELRNNVEFKVNEEGTLLIEVSDRDAQRAADMASAFVTLLDEINRGLSTQEAKNNRDFIEQRVNQNLKDLTQAENELKAFQEKNGFVALPEQALTAASAVGQLYAQKELKAIEVSVLKKTVGEENPQYRSALMQLSALDQKLKTVPQVGMEYLRLYREYIIQQKLYETLLPLLEQARIEEQRDTPTLLVLDQPRRAEKPYRPQKRLIVGVFFLLSLLTTISLALLVDRLHSLEEGRAAEWKELVGMARSLFPQKATKKQEFPLA